MRNTVMMLYNIKAGIYESPAFYIDVNEYTMLYVTMNGDIKVKVDDTVYDYKTLYVVSHVEQYIKISRGNVDLLVRFSNQTSVVDFVRFWKMNREAMQRKLGAQFVELLKCIAVFTEQYGMLDPIQKCIVKAEEGIIRISVNRYTNLDMRYIQKKYDSLGHKDGILADNLAYKCINVKFTYTGGAPK